jgi:hypothetical protein
VLAQREEAAMVPHRLHGRTIKRGMDNFRKKWQSAVMLDLTGEVRMVDPDVASAALARAWSAYRLIYNDVREADDRRSALDRFIRKQCDAGVKDPELLAVEGLKYLKRLDQSETDLS